MRGAYKHTGYILPVRHQNRFDRDQLTPLPRCRQYRLRILQAREEFCGGENPRTAGLHTAWCSRPNSIVRGKHALRASENSYVQVSNVGSARWVL